MPNRAVLDAQCQTVVLNAQCQTVRCWTRSAKPCGSGRAVPNRAVLNAQCQIVVLNAQCQTVEVPVLETKTPRPSPVVDVLLRGHSLLVRVHLPLLPPCPPPTRNCLAQRRE